MSEQESPDDGPPPASAAQKTGAVVWALGLVVVILLTFVAMAAPKWGGFGSRCKSKQSEAKTNLSGIFTAEKAFWGEHGFYTTDLVMLNWAPDGSPAYLYGFAVPSEAKPDMPELDPTRRTTLDARVVGDPARYSVKKMRTLADRPLTDDDLQKAAPRSSVSETGFLAVAVGDVDSDWKAERLDVWTIDERRYIESLSNDCLD